MEFLISSAWAQDAGAGGPGGLMSLLPLIFIFVIFYFLFIRPQQKRMKEHKAMVEALKKGDEIVTNGGIAGSITDVGENFIALQVDDNVTVKVQKHAIASLLPKGTLKKA